MKPRSAISRQTRAALWAGAIALAAYWLVALLTALSQMPGGEAVAVSLRSVPFAAVVGAMVFGIVLLIQQPAFDRDNFSHVAEPLLLHYPDRVPESESKPFFGSVRIEHRSQTVAELLTGRTDFPARFSSGSDGVRLVTLSYGNAVFIPWDHIKLEGSRLWKSSEVRLDCLRTPSITVALTIPEGASAVLFPGLELTEPTAAAEARTPVLQWIALAATLVAAALMYRLL